RIDYAVGQLEKKLLNYRGTKGEGGRPSGCGHQPIVVERALGAHGFERGQDVGDTSSGAREWQQRPFVVDSASGGVALGRSGITREWGRKRMRIGLERRFEGWGGQDLVQESPDATHAAVEFRDAHTMKPDLKSWAAIDRHHIEERQIVTRVCQRIRVQSLPSRERCHATRGIPAAKQRALALRPDDIWARVQELHENAPRIPRPRNAHARAPSSIASLRVKRGTEMIDASRCPCIPKRGVPASVGEVRNWATRWRRRCEKGRAPCQGLHSPRPRAAAKLTAIPSN